jgi:ATP-binding cassette subfamily C protein LapB
MAKVSLDTLDAIMRMPDDRPHSLQPISPAVCQGKLRLDKLKFGYEPQVLAVDMPALEIQPGERVAIMGPVGGGKSTLIKLLAGLYKPQEGSIHLDGVDMFQLAPEFIRAHLAYLPQDVRLFQGTLRENLTLGLPSPSDADLLQVAQPLGLDTMIASHPLGFDSPIQEGGRGLSGGQRQMVGLARMLLSHPQILLLDEPTASMDATLEKRVMDHLFTTLPPSTTIVVATHKLHVLQHVQRIVFVVNGRVAMDGPRDQVLNKLTGFVANA